VLVADLKKLLDLRNGIAILKIEKKGKYITSSISEGA